MRIMITICALALSTFESGFAGQRSNSVPPKPLQMRLGYSADAKLLILNADDLGVAHAEAVASFAALDRKPVT